MSQQAVPSVSDGPANVSVMQKLTSNPVADSLPSKYPAKYHDPNERESFEAEHSDQAREWVEEALDLFMQVWKMEAQKLRNEDRQTIIIRAHDALSGKCSFLLIIV